MINRSNYEEYFLDYFDGSLSDARKQQLFTFLSENPDLKAEFDKFSVINLPEEKTFFDKDTLKRNTITKYNYKTYFIGYVEGDLSAQERTEVEDFLEKNPALQQELILFSNIKLQPDYSIVFGNKNHLKKGGKVISINTWIYRTAALAASIAIVFFLFYYRNIDNSTHVATNEVRKESNAPIHSKIKSETKITMPPPVDIEKEIPGNKNKIRTNDNKLDHQHHRREPQPSAVEEPMVAQGNKQLTTAEQPSLAENKQTDVEQSVPIVIIKQDKPAGDTAKSFSVFTEEELAELGVTEIKPQSTSFISKTAGDLGKKLFGQNARLENSTNEEAGTQTFALTAGNFEFSRTIAR